MAKRRLTEQQKRRIASKQNQLLSESEISDSATGTVISHHGHELIVEDPDNRQYTCKLRQNLGDIACGDTVLFVPHENKQEGVVVALGERSNLLQKTGFGGRARAVAANIDQIIIVCALEPEPNTYLIDRYLIAAENMPARPVIVLNKIDLNNPANQAYVDTLQSIYQPIGYRVILTSAKNLTGIDELEKTLMDATSILVGLSGVGKTSLINDLIPDVNARVGDLSTASAEGKHTTTVASLYHLPRGGNLIDSPGVRDFTPHNQSRDYVVNGFVELRNLRGQCRFADCTHNHEPDCAIRNAVDRGDISKQRMASFQHMLRELNQSD